MPTPETTSIMVTERVSTRKVQGISRLPILIHSAKGMLCASPPFASNEYPSRSETTNARPEAALATVPMAISFMRLPKIILTINPATGRRTIRGTRLKNSPEFSIRYPFRLLIWSTSILCLLRKIATINASPTATSAAATVMTKKTKI